MDSVESDPELIRKNPANQEVLKMEEIRKLRSIRELEVAGSNPVAPTIFPISSQILSVLCHKPIDSKSRRLPLSL